MTSGRSAGPIPHLLRQTPAHVKLEQGTAMHRLVVAGSSIRQAAATLGLSPTTGWRRYWWLLDWTLPDMESLPRGPFPPQRGTKACPSGRPYLPTWPIDNPAARQPFRLLHGDIPVYVGPAGARGIVWSTGQIAVRMGLSRERVRQLSHTASWPKLVGKPSGRRVWLADDIDRWIRRHRPDLEK